MSNTEPQTHKPKDNPTCKGHKSVCGGFTYHVKAYGVITNNSHNETSEYCPYCDPDNDSEWVTE